MSERQDRYWGLCPICEQPAERWWNLREKHWLTCELDRVRWYVGSNLISGWRWESPGDWVANALRIQDYEEVVSLDAPEFIRDGWER